MVRNSAKSNWTIEELDWHIHPSGQIEDWDGLLSWATEFIQANPELQNDALIKKWHSVALKIKQKN